MNKLLKVILALAMVVVMPVAFCACGDSQQTEEQTEDAGVANPVHECESADEVCQATGLSIEAPEGATDVVYSYIDATDEEGEAIAQVVFTLDGNEYCYRCQSTAETSLGNDDEEADSDELLESLDTDTNKALALAGIYAEWSAGGTTLVSERDGVFALNEGKEGVIAWLDVVPGVMYSLSMDKGASQDLLQATAEASFVPMQGEADGE